MKLHREPKPTRTPSRFQFSIADRISFLNAEDWDCIAETASVFLSRRYLAAAEQEFTDTILRRFAIVYEQHQPVAILATQTFDVHGDQLVKNAAEEEGLPDELKRKGLALLKRRVMMCGNVHTWGRHGVAFADEDRVSEIWPGVADALYRIRRADKLHGQTDYVLIKDLLGQQCEEADVLDAFGYRALDTEPNMVLTLKDSWTSFEDYLNDLKKKYRAAVRKTMKPFANDPFQVAPIADHHAEASRIYELYQSVLARADVRMFGLQQTTLPNLADALQDDFVTIGIREDGRLIGFVNVIRDGSTAIGYYIGIDYETNSTLPIYHRLLFAVIEQAIQWNCREVSFGRTALDAKSRLGCVPVKTQVQVRHRIPLLNFVVHQLLKNVSANEPPDRNPFKES